MANNIAAHKHRTRLHFAITADRYLGELARSRAGDVDGDFAADELDEPVAFNDFLADVREPAGDDERRRRRDSKIGNDDFFHVRQSAATEVDLASCHASSA